VEKEVGQLVLLVCKTSIDVLHHFLVVSSLSLHQHVIFVLVDSLLTQQLIFVFLTPLRLLTASLFKKQALLQQFAEFALTEKYLLLTEKIAQPQQLMSTARSQD